MSYARYSLASLRQLAIDALLKLGVPSEHAEVFADGLIIADARGIESHGVARLNAYVLLLEHGLMDGKAEPTIVNEAPGTALVDANNGLGHVASKFSMQLAISKARQTGMGWVTVRNSNHYGIAGYYAAMALEHNLVGFCATNSGPVVAPLGGRTKQLGTNPIAVAAPADQEEAFLLDMATSAVAGGKLQIAAWEDKPVPRGWGLDADGHDTTDPNAVLAPGGAMLPLGSFLELAGYKGYGLAMAIEILTGVLGGGQRFGPDVMNLSLAIPDRPCGVSHFFAALDIGRFIPLSEFKARMDHLIRVIRDSPRAPGFERIFIAGEKEKLAERDHRANGVPLHPSVVESLRDVAQRLGVDFPNAARVA
jgi:L-2-hydroxycarboxylate dehydrogenase (NAD+)